MGLNVSSEKDGSLYTSKNFRPHVAITLRQDHYPVNTLRVKVRKPFDWSGPESFSGRC